MKKINILKNTKIIATIGNNSSKLPILIQFLKAGVNIIRINFSHGNIEDNNFKMSNFIKAKKITNSQAGILLDTKGPEIRTLSLKNKNKILLKKSQIFNFSLDSTLIGNTKVVGVDYPNLINIIKIKDFILVDDGLLSFTVINIDKHHKLIKCIVNNDGYLGEYKGINLPGININLPILSHIDKLYINDIFKKYEVQFLALSFVRNYLDILEVKKYLQMIAPNHHTKIIAKIENQEGINNIDNIINHVDGIMIARGDLGVEIPIEQVIIYQKHIIKKCNNKGKIVITATQMLESMINNPRPTRAEAGDVANAILDGSDAIMLSAETAIGQYPIIAISTMVKICQTTEIQSNLINKHTLYNNNLLDNICCNIINLSLNPLIKLIVVVSNSLIFFRSLRKFNPNIKIIFLTNNKHILNLILLTKCMYGILIEDFENKKNKDLIKLGIKVAKYYINLNNTNYIIFYSDKKLKLNKQNMLLILKI